MGIKKFFLGLFLFAASVIAQPGPITGVVNFSIGTSLPTTCVPSPVVSFYLYSGGVYTPYYCSATNTWTVFGGGGSGTVNSGTVGEPAIYSAATAVSSSGAYLDCSQFAGADDSLKIQACFQALYTLNNTAGIADARGMTGGTWSVNPFAVASNAIPVHGELWMPGGTVVTSVPIIGHDEWLVKGVAGGQQASVLKASAGFKTLYTTGTVTVGTAGLNDVITGSGTGWSTSNIAVGCAFVSPAAGAPTYNLTYGIVSAITSATSITLAWGRNNGTGAPAASNYAIYCPVFLHGNGAFNSNGYDYYVSVQDMTFDANNLSGVIPEMDWYGAHPTFIRRVNEQNFCNIGLDVEGMLNQNGYIDEVSSHPGTCGTAATVPVIFEGGGGQWAAEHISIDQGASSFAATNGILVGGNGISMSHVDIAGAGVGIAVNDIPNCNPACPWGGIWGGSASNVIDLNDVHGVATTLVHLSNTYQTPHNVVLRNIGSASTVTNVLVDDGNACTDTLSPDYGLSLYTLDATGLIASSTSTIAACQPPRTKVSQVLTADVTCGTGGTISSCTTAKTITGLTFPLPQSSSARNYTFECDLIIGQATAATANQFLVQTATNGATNLSAFAEIYTAAGTATTLATTGQGSTTTAVEIGGATWTLGGTGTKTPARIWGTIEGANTGGSTLNIQVIAPTVADLLTIYRGSACHIW